MTGLLRMTHPRLRRTEIALATILASAPWMGAQTPVIPAEGVRAMTLQRPDASYATLTTFSPPDAPFRSGVEVRVLWTSEFPWNVQLNVPTTEPVALNDVLLATFTMCRASTVPDEGLTTLIFERAGDPWNKSMERTLVEGEGTWQQWHIAFKAAGDYAALFRRDWTPTPNALAWSNVAFNTWSTDVRQTAAHLVPRHHRPRPTRRPPDHQHPPLRVFQIVPAQTVARRYRPLTRHSSAV